MSQKAILTFTDTEDDQVSVRLEFDPPVKGNDRMTAAIGMAMQALQSVRNRHEEEDED